ncbi:hypothetical protein CCH79_00012586, partial [Gambusia affinis]
MLREIRQVLRLIQLMGKQRKQSSLKNTGALLVLLWTEKGSSHQMLNCTVATAGSWCFGITMHTLQADLKKVLLPGVWPCPEPDPEELSAFTDLYGSLKFLLNFQVKNPGHYSSKWQAHVKAFLQTFGLTNAGIRIQLKFKIHGQKSQHDFSSAFLISKVALSVQPPLILDVTCSAQPWCDQRGSWCQKGHPVVGERFPLSIPPKAMDQGLFGELSVQIVTLLSPCVLVFSPSNIPVSAPSGFFQTLPVALDYQHLGLDRMHCRSSKASPDDPVHSDGVVFTVDQENWDDPKQEPGHLPVQQSLLLLLFLQHSDPFTSGLTDKMDCELLLELHLEDILSNNRQAVTSALQAELFNTTKALKERKKARKTFFCIKFSTL